MHVSNVRPSLAWFNHNVVKVEIAVLLLSAAHSAHNMSDSFVQPSIVALTQKVTSAFHPLAQVTIPEQVRWDGPVPLVIVDGVPLELETVITTGTLQKIKLSLKSDLRDCVPPYQQCGRPVEGGMGEGSLRIRHVGSTTASRACLDLPLIQNYTHDEEERRNGLLRLEQ